ncbi:MAG: hypothetical protein H7240_07410 [Glaciimonas sp.]|nr:hypothetical protein [Glaciimonas sp.]
MRLVPSAFYPSLQAISVIGMRQRVRSVLLFSAVLVLSSVALASTAAHAQEAARPAENSIINQDTQQRQAEDVHQYLKQGTLQPVKTRDNPIFSIDPNTILDTSIPAADFAARHPIGSVSSVVGADEVLTDVAKARADVELRNLNRQRLCYKKFFTTQCLNAAKEQRRLALKKIRPLEIEANAFKRHAAADDRDKALADQALKEVIASPKREQDQKEKESTKARKVKEGDAKAAAVEANTKLHAGDTEKRVTDNAEKL